MRKPGRAPEKRAQEFSIGRSQTVATALARVANTGCSCERRRYSTYSLIANDAQEVSAAGLQAAKRAKTEEDSCSLPKLKTEVN